MSLHSLLKQGGKDQIFKDDGRDQDKLYQSDNKIAGQFLKQDSNDARYINDSNEQGIVINNSMPDGTVDQSGSPFAKRNKFFRNRAIVRKRMKVNQRKDGTI